MLGLSELEPCYGYSETVFTHVYLIKSYITGNVKVKENILREQRSFQLRKSL